MAEEVKKTDEIVEAPVGEASATDTAATADGSEKAAPPRRKKAKRTVASGQIHVLATFNNTIITVTDEKGNTLTAASAGGSGFRGSKKGTAYAAQVAAEKAVNAAKQNYGFSKAEVLVKGVGLGRDAAIRTLANQKVAIESIRDVTGVPHGGVRPRKAKRN
jgi:small subunit ribosomal protein S11